MAINGIVLTEINDRAVESAEQDQIAHMCSQSCSTFPMIKFIIANSRTWLILSQKVFHNKP